MTSAQALSLTSLGAGTFAGALGLRAFVAIALVGQGRVGICQEQEEPEIG